MDQNMILLWIRTTAQCTHISSHIFWILIPVQVFFKLLWVVTATSLQQCQRMPNIQTYPTYFAWSLSKQRTNISIARFFLIFQWKLNSLSHKPLSPPSPPWNRDHFWIVYLGLCTLFYRVISSETFRLRTFRIQLCSR